MPPCSDERDPPPWLSICHSSPSTSGVATQDSFQYFHSNHSNHQSHICATVARLLCICLLIGVPSLMLIMAVISSTRTQQQQPLTVTTSPQILFPDEQLQKYKSELRALTRRLQWQLKKLTLESDAGHKIPMKRQALEPSTASPNHKPSTTATPVTSIQHTTTPSFNVSSTKPTVNISNITVMPSAANDSWIKIGQILDPSAISIISSGINSTNMSSNATVVSESRTNFTIAPHTMSAATSMVTENATSTPDLNLRASLAPFVTESVTEPIEVPSSTPMDPLGGSKDGLLKNATRCVQFTEEQLVKELKQHGTYNPDFMAWDVRGVLNFFERASTDNYDRLKKSQERAMTIEQNLAAVEQLVKELNLQNCNLRTPDVLARLYNLSSSFSTRGAASSFESNDYGRLRTKRQHQDTDEIDPALLAKAKYIYDLYMHNGASRDDSIDAKVHSTGYPSKSSAENEGIIGQVHVVPSGCRKRGSSEDGYLRLCSACQAIRRLPDTFFPPFLNEVTCDEDKACLYFYDYPHGKCRQKHLNLVVLKNVGTPECQLWKRYNLNVRVSCECFVDEMSFFAKYV